MFTKQELIALFVTLGVVIVVAGIFTFFFARYAKSTASALESGEADIELIDSNLASKSSKAMRRKKIGTIVSNVAFYAFLAISVPLLAIAVINRVNGGVLSFGDTSVLLVGSGSMSMKHDINKYYLDDPELRAKYNLDNQFQTNDLIFLHTPKDQKEINLYDVISFYDTSKNQMTIHRVIEIDKSTARYVFTTRGDANGPRAEGDSTDPSAYNDPFKSTFADIRGVYTSNRIPGVGLLILFFQSPSGIATMLAVLYLLGMVGHFTRKIDLAARSRTELLDGIINKETPEGTKEVAIIYKGCTYRFGADGSYQGKTGSETEGSTLTRVILTQEGATKQTYQLGSYAQKKADDGQEDNSPLRRHR